MTKAIRLAAAKRRGRRRWAIPAGVAVGLLAAVWIVFEVMAATDFQRRSIEARGMEDRGQFADARAVMEDFGRTLYRHSLFSGSKGKRFIEEMGDRQRPPPPPPPPPKITDPKVLEANKRAEERKKAEARMTELERSVEELRKLGDLSGALEAARELAKLAETWKDDARKEVARKAEDEVGGYEREANRYRDDALRLEQEGKYKEAAEKIAYIFRVRQHSSAAKTAQIPLVLRTSRAGVEVSRDGKLVDVTKGADLILRIKKDDKPFLVTLTKKGFRSVEKKIDDFTVGVLDVRVDERLADWQFPLGAPIAAPPIVDGDVIYVRTRERILGLALENRAVRWQVRLENSPAPALRQIGGLLFAASGKSILVIDPSRGDDQNVVRTMPVDATIIGAIGVSDSKDVLFFGTAGGGVVALHAQTGATVWKRMFPREVIAEPVEHQGTLLVACRDGFIYAVKGPELGSPDANLAWRSSAAVGDIDSAPVIHEGVGYVGTGTGRVAAIDLSNGKVQWTESVESPVTGRLGLCGGRLCAPTLAGTLAAVDREKRDTAWVYKAEGPLRGGAVTGSGYILVGSDDRWLHAVSESGDLLWKAGAGRGVAVGAVIAGNRVYFGSDDQILYALTLD